MTVTLPWTRRHRQLLGRLLWLDRPDIKNAVCQLSTHVGTATTRDEINIKRLLRYLIGNHACNMIVGCNLDVPGSAGTPQGSVVVLASSTFCLLLSGAFPQQDEGFLGSGLSCQDSVLSCADRPHWPGFGYRWLCRVLKYGLFSGSEVLRLRDPELPTRRALPVSPVLVAASGAFP